MATSPERGRAVQIRLRAEEMKELRLLAALLDVTPATLVRVGIEQMVAQNRTVLLGALRAALDKHEADDQG